MRTCLRRSPALLNLRKRQIKSTTSFTPMPDPAIQSAPSAAPAEFAEQLGEFDSLLSKQFKPKTDYAKAAVESAVRILAAQALEATKLISGDSIKAIEAII